MQRLTDGGDEKVRHWRLQAPLGSSFVGGQTDRYIPANGNGKYHHLLT